MDELSVSHFGDVLILIRRSHAPMILGVGRLGGSLAGERYAAAPSPRARTGIQDRLRLSSPRPRRSRPRPPWRDGDLRKLPQLGRKQALLDLLGENDVGLPVLYSEHLTGDGQEMFEHAAKLNWEGIISKRADAPYRSERNESWLKIKTVQKGKFPVVGFVKDPTGVAALYLGKREGKELVYMGKVGTGWSRTISSQIRKQLDTVVSPKSKLTKSIKSRRPRGSSRLSTPTWSIGTSLPRGCSGQARSKACRKEQDGGDDARASCTRRWGN